MQYLQIIALSPGGVKLDLFQNGGSIQMNAKIRIALVEETGSLPVLREAPVPAGNTGLLRVRMRAAALNFADLLKTEGRYQEAEALPFIPGLEGAGEVIDAPQGAALQPGQRVALRAPGTMSEIVAVPEAACLPIPDAMSFAQAAGFQIAYGSSHLALHLRGGLQPGERLAVLGAAGGVGLTAVEIGAAMGAEVIGVARGADKLAAVRQAGAAHVIDSADIPDLKTALRDLGGVDVVYDPVGDAPGLAAFGALRRGGRFLVIGFAGGTPPALPLNHALVKNIAIHGFYWGGYDKLNPEALRASLRDLLALFEAGRLAPHLGLVLPLERIGEGYAALRERRSTGKVIITL